jgi:hypothetical protein
VIDEGVAEILADVLLFCFLQVFWCEFWLRRACLWAARCCAFGLAFLDVGSMLFAGFLGVCIEFSYDGL